MKEYEIGGKKIRTRKVEIEQEKWDESKKEKGEKNDGTGN